MGKPELTSFKSYPTQNIWLKLFSNTDIITYSHPYFIKAKFSDNLNKQTKFHPWFLPMLAMLSNSSLLLIFTKLYSSKKLKSELENLPVMTKAISVCIEYLDIALITIISFFFSPEV